jgi:hypothetical protein
MGPAKDNLPLPWEFQTRKNPWALQRQQFLRKWRSRHK